MDTDATAKRVAQVRHIQSKPYYKPVIEEPNPFMENCSTRMWKYKMRVWVERLKKTQTCDEGLPQHEGAAADVTSDSQ